MQSKERNELLSNVLKGNAGHRDTMDWYLPLLWAWILSDAFLPENPEKAKNIDWSDITVNIILSQSSKIVWC